MKSISTDELDLLSAESQHLIGGQLQEVLTSDRYVQLEIFNHGALFWLWFDLQPATPFMITLSDRDPQPQGKNGFKKKSTPLGLFLKAHGRGRRLSKLTRTEGRTVEVEFGDPRKPDEILKLEVRLFPHGTNILVTGNGKKIAWQKPKEVVPFKDTHGQLENAAVLRARDVLLREWIESRSGTLGASSAAGGKGAKSKPVKKIDTVKLSAILLRLEEQIEIWQNPWRDLGEWIKEHQSLKVLKEWKPLLDPQARTIAAHIQSAFTAAKKQDHKFEGIKRRVRELKIEIGTAEEKNRLAEIALESGESQKANASSKSTSSKGSGASDQEPNSLFHNTDSRGRRAQLNEHVDLYVGKSAVDNLNLLRHAQSWDLWMHVRDVPGCHAILRRPRGFEVDDELLRLAAKKVVSFSPQASREIRPGDQFDVTICEVRFVKPVKGGRVGGKIGHVNYHNDRTLRVKF